jgi:S-adenosylmethionine:tRNA ribosyltransferase-isomerase
MMTHIDDSRRSDFCLADLHYDLPRELIAQYPLERRDDSRILVLNRQEGTIHDSNISDFAGLLNADDLLVLNDTRVLPARLSFVRGSGGRVRGLFLEEVGASQWRLMLENSRRLRVGELLQTDDPTNCVTIKLLENCGGGIWRISLNTDEPAEAVLQRVGQTPLPPYILRKQSGLDSEARDCERYQTVYARHPGAVAAPTAGLHLSPQILHQVRQRLTLHVGPGTFKPISAHRLADHVMHYERFEISPETVEAWKECRRRRGRVVAVGTTVVRVLETALADPSGSGARTGSTNLFIYPPYQITTVDALLTNFHLPESTLLALVMSFAGIDLTRRAYKHSIAARYRFYSYGDAMFIA